MTHWYRTTAYVNLCLIFLWPVSVFPADLNSIVQTALAEAQQTMDETSLQYLEARSRALELGKVGLGTVDSRDELQRQRVVVESFLHATLKAVAAIREFEPYVAVRVRAAKFPEDAVESVRQSVRSALASANSEQKIQRMRLDMDWTDVTQERYQLLQNYWGKWYRDKKDPRKIDSRDTEFTRKFNMLGNNIYKIEKQANQISNTL